MYIRWEEANHSGHRSLEQPCSFHRSEYNSYEVISSSINNMTNGT